MTTRGLMIVPTKYEKIILPKSQSKPIEISSPKKSSNPDLFALNLQHSAFDPTNTAGSPPNMFMQNLQSRMDSYFDQNTPNTSSW